MQPVNATRRPLSPAAGGGFRLYGSRWLAAGAVTASFVLSAALTLALS